MKSLEQIEMLFIQMNQGNHALFYTLVDDLLEIVVEEVEQLDEEVYKVALSSLFCAIKSYNREKQGDSISFIKRYVHLSVLIYLENRVKLEEVAEIQFPTLGVIITNDQFQNYIEKVKKMVADRKNKENFMKKLGKMS